MHCCRRISPLEVHEPKIICGVVVDSSGKCLPECTGMPKTEISGLDRIGGAEEGAMCVFVCVACGWRN
jgi:hypothetical protein